MSLTIASHLRSSNLSSIISSHRRSSQFIVGFDCCHNVIVTIPMDRIRLATSGAHQRVLYTVRWKDGHDSLENRRTLQVYYPQLLADFEQRQVDTAPPEALSPPSDIISRLFCLVYIASLLAGVTALLTLARGNERK